MKLRSWTFLLTACFAVSTLLVAQDPPAGKPDSQVLSESLRGVINTGVKLFNDNGDYVGCYRLFHGSLLSIKPFIAEGLQKDIDASIAKAEALAKYDDRAFELRGCLDRVRAQLKADGTPKALPPAVVEEKKPVIPPPLVEDKKPLVPPPLVEDKKPIVPLPLVEDKKPIVPPPLVEDKKPLVPPPLVEDKKPIVPPPLVEDKKPLVPPPLVEDKKPIVPPPLVEDKKPLVPPPLVEDKKPLVPPPLVEDKKPIVPPPLVEDKKPAPPLVVPPPLVEDKKPVPPPVIEEKPVPPPVIEEKPLPAPKGRVSGKVLYQGKPVPAGDTTIDYKDQPRPAAYVVLVSEQGQRLSTAVNMDGTYSFKIPVPPGEYKVVIDSAPETTIDPKDDIPARYRSIDSTTLMVDVVVGPQVLDLNLVK